MEALTTGGGSAGRIDALASVVEGWPLMLVVIGEGRGEGCDGWGADMLFSSMGFEEI